MFAGEQHHPEPTPEGQWVPPSAALGTWEITGLLGRWKRSYGVLALAAPPQSCLHLLLLELKLLLCFCKHRSDLWALLFKAS